MEARSVTSGIRAVFPAAMSTTPASFYDDYSSAPPYYHYPPQPPHQNPNLNPYPNPYASSAPPFSTSDYSPYPQSYPHFSHNPDSTPLSFNPTPPPWLPPPPVYGFHNLDRRTIVLADSTVRSYFALPSDYIDFPPPPQHPRCLPFGGALTQDRDQGVSGQLAPSPAAKQEAKLVRLEPLTSCVPQHTATLNDFSASFPMTAHLVGTHTTSLHDSRILVHDSMDSCVEKHVNLNDEVFDDDFVVCSESLSNAHRVIDENPERDKVTWATTNQCAGIIKADKLLYEMGLISDAPSEVLWDSIWDYVMVEATKVVTSKEKDATYGALKMDESGDKGCWFKREGIGVVVTLVDDEDQSFWTGAEMVIKATMPLVRTLELIYEADKPLVGNIYETMDQVKELWKTKVLESPAKKVYRPSSSKGAKRKKRCTYQSSSSESGSDDDTYYVLQDSATTHVSPNENEGSKGGGRIDAAADSVSMNFQRCIGRFFYETGLEFTAASSPSFKRMISFVAASDVKCKISSREEIKGCIFRDEVKEMKEYARKIKESWATTGCSILLDSWSDEKDRSLVNFLVNCPQCPIYLSTHDVSSFVGNVKMMSALLDKIIKDVGADNVVQIVADTTTGWVGALGKEFNKRTGVFWALSASHCIEMMLGRIGMTTSAKVYLDKAKIITKFIYGNEEVLKLFKKHTNGRDLIKHSKIRGAMPFMTLDSIVYEKQELPLVGAVNLAADDIRFDALLKMPLQPAELKGKVMDVKAAVMMKERKKHKKKLELEVVDVLVYDKSGDESLINAHEKSISAPIETDHLADTPEECGSCENGVGILESVELQKQLEAPVNGNLKRLLFMLLWTL